MKMHVTLTVIAMFFASGTALAQNSVHNPHGWGNEAALAATAQKSRIAREAGTGLAVQEPRIAREAGTGLTEVVQEPATRVVVETDPIGEKAVVRANPHQ